MQAERIRCTVRYDGTGFAGSQIQPGRRTVAGTLKNELESLLASEVHLLFAGRTDAGVHADGNVCSFDAVLPFPAVRLPRIINPRLPEDLEVRDARVARLDFHPRYSAIARMYVYRLYRGLDVPVDRRRYCQAYAGAWNSRAVEAALALLGGRQSFHNFAKGERGPGYAICNLDPPRLAQRGLEMELWWRADRFLRQMVRNLTAAVLEVAAGRLTLPMLRDALQDDSKIQFKPAPAAGLTLVSVEYDDEDELR